MLIMNRSITKDADLPVRIANQFVRITNVILTGLNGPEGSKTILVSSSSHGEGASTVAHLLSRTLAEEHGKKVLLLDFDFRSHRRNPERRVEKGFADWYEEGFTEDFIQAHPQLPNCCLLPHGSVPCDPPRIVDSPKFFEFIQNLKNLFSFIIIDASPLQPYPEACLLAPRVDGVILVVEAEGPRKEIVLDSVKKLSAGQSNFLGIILNRRKHYIPAWLYERL
jgi:capsular exopolysaccharide synthesis family protein